MTGAGSSFCNHFIQPLFNTCVFYTKLPVLFSKENDINTIFKTEACGTKILFSVKLLSSNLIR